MKKEINIGTDFKNNLKEFEKLLGRKFSALEKEISKNFYIRGRIDAIKEITK